MKMNVTDKPGQRRRSAIQSEPSQRPSKGTQTNGTYRPAFRNGMARNGRGTLKPKPLLTGENTRSGLNGPIMRSKHSPKPGSKTPTNGKSGIEVLASVTAKQAEILTPAALEFYARLHREFNS